jgi:hypothetical protein
MRKQGRVREGEGIILQPTIMPERGGSAISNINKGNVTVGGKPIVDDFPQIGCGRGRVIREDGLVMEKPIPPGSLNTSKQLINKFHE